MTASSPSPDGHRGSVISHDLLTRIDLEGCRSPASVGADTGTRGRLLQAAVEQFGLRGYDACSMRGLAVAVGRRPASIYNHYTSKVELLIAAVDFVLSDFMTHVLGDLPEASARGRLSTILHRHIDYRATHQTITKANDRLMQPDFMLRTMPAEDRLRFTAALREYINIIRELVAQVSGESPAADDLLRTFALLNLLNESASWYCHERAIDSSLLASQINTMAERLLGLQPETLE